MNTWLYKRKEVALYIRKSLTQALFFFCCDIFMAFNEEVKAAQAVSGRRVLSARLEPFDSVQLLLLFFCLLIV